LIERRVEVVAKRSDYRALISGLYFKGINERREVACPLQVEHIGKRPRLRLKGAEGALGGVIRPTCPPLRLARRSHRRFRSDGLLLTFGEPRLGLGYQFNRGIDDLCSAVFDTHFVSLLEDRRAFFVKPANFCLRLSDTSLAGSPLGTGGGQRACGVRKLCLAREDGRNAFFGNRASGCDPMRAFFHSAPQLILFRVEAAKRFGRVAGDFRFVLKIRLRLNPTIDELLSPRSPAGLLALKFLGKPFQCFEGSRSCRFLFA
jgi:hypothetical protein